MSVPVSIKLVGVSGSLRKQSYNSGALRMIPSILPEGVEFEIADISKLPFYNADVEQIGLPEAVQAFRGQVSTADALIFAVPEYNFSIPGILKNVRVAFPPAKSAGKCKTGRCFWSLCQPPGYSERSIPFSSRRRVAEYDDGERTAC
jgi:hypothetical protein